MQTMNISLPDELRDYVEARVAEASYSTVSDYMRELIRQDQVRAAERRLADLIGEGIASGESVPIDADYWARKKARASKAPDTPPKST